MIFREFENELKDSLRHLYDPLYVAPASLCEVLGVDARQGVEPVQRRLIDAIWRFQPQPLGPPNTPLARFHKLLSCRYIHGLTQQATADKLYISTRYLRKQQQKAVRGLAKMLWERSQGNASLSDGQTATRQIAVHELPDTGQRSPDWTSQVQQELACLARQAPGAEANVEVILHDAVGLVRTLTHERGIHLEIGAAKGDLFAAVHPSVLREILIAGVTGLVKHMTSGVITLSADQQSDRVQIRIAGRPARLTEPLNHFLIQEMMYALHGSFTVETADGCASLCVDLPASKPQERITVLVVEDNADLVCFYRAYAERTRYEILHVAEARHVPEMVEAHKPDVIVLDMMLPDPEVDGWKLLVQLHGDPATRTIPLVVCSVVRERDLALALGAASYVSKPVARREFIRALDEALSPPTP